MSFIFAVHLGTYKHHMQTHQEGCKLHPFQKSGLFPKAAIWCATTSSRRGGVCVFLQHYRIEWSLWLSPQVITITTNLKYMHFAPFFLVCLYMPLLPNGPFPHKQLKLVSPYTQHHSIRQFMYLKAGFNHF